MSFHPYNLDGLRCAKRILTWAGNSRSMPWREVNYLMKNVLVRERAFISCITKEPYASWELANKVASRHNRNREARKVYRCEVCHRFHVASIEGTRERQQRIQRLREREAAEVA